MHAVVFTAIPTGGAICCQPGETLEVSYFSYNDLPAILSFGHRRRILNSIQGLNGAVISQQSVNPSNRNFSRQELYPRRDNSGMSPEQFYISLFDP